MDFRKFFSKKSAKVYKAQLILSPDADFNLNGNIDLYYYDKGKAMDEVLNKLPTTDWVKFINDEETESDLDFDKLTIEKKDGDEITVSVNDLKLALLTIELKNPSYFLNEPESSFTENAALISLNEYMKENEMKITTKDIRLDSFKIRIGETGVKISDSEGK